MPTQPAPHSQAQSTYFSLDTQTATKPILQMRKWSKSWGQLVKHHTRSIWLGRDQKLSSYLPRV